MGADAVQIAHDPGDVASLKAQGRGLNRCTSLQAKSAILRALAIAEMAAAAARASICVERLLRVVIHRRHPRSLPRRVRQLPRRGAPLQGMSRIMAEQMRAESDDPCVDIPNGVAKRLLAGPPCLGRAALPAFLVPPPLTASRRAVPRHLVLKHVSLDACATVSAVDDLPHATGVDLNEICHDAILTQASDISRTRVTSSCSPAADAHQ